ncbi:MAG: 3-hydroxyacyl-ACP dehydratase FabZ [Sphingomonadales bacterium]|nr:3-hydroxyacyl-ACP dehydratase FabZ [Sphingomonadales bacterium]
MSEVLEPIDVIGIMEKIPHRYPLLLVDRVEDIVLGESATGIKCVTINEGFFQGHFPQKPIMPGVLIVEAMAQTAAVMVVASMGDEAEGKLVYFMTIDAVKFRKPVGPGDVLKMKVKKVQARRTMWKFRGEAFVNDKLVAEANFSAMIADA